MAAMISASPAMMPTITFLRLGADAVAALPVAPTLGSCVVESCVVESCVVEYMGYFSISRSRGRSGVFLSTPMSFGLTPAGSHPLRGRLAG